MVVGEETDLQCLKLKMSEVVIMKAVWYAYTHVFMVDLQMYLWTTEPPVNMLAVARVPIIMGVYVDIINFLLGHESFMFSITQLV